MSTMIERLLEAKRNAPDSATVRLAGQFEGERISLGKAAAELFAGSRLRPLSLAAVEEAWRIEALSGRGLLCGFTAEQRRAIEQLTREPAHVRRAREQFEAITRGGLGRMMEAAQRFDTHSEEEGEDDGNDDIRTDD